MRELKLKGGVLYAGDRTVAPLRVRELKLNSDAEPPNNFKVAPLRVRELKQAELRQANEIGKSHPYGCVN